LRLIESELNRLIGESTAARHRLAELAGTSFAVHVEGLGLTVVLHSDGERIRVDGEATTATATLRATPLDLLHLARAEGAGAVKRTKASLTGDLQVAERYAELLKLARPDLEGEAANWVGDVPAPLEADAFYAEVENLRDDVERAAARLARLERR
jgi:ubiquinone biosynthesis protein UbiJ